MASKRLLHLNAERLTALLWRDGALKTEGRFPHGEAGLAAFAKYLARRHGSHFYLLADVADEDYRIEMLPYARGADRDALLARKLGQQPLAAAISYGRKKSGRRDEKILFAALTRPRFFAPWLDTLRDAEAQLAGIWPLPLLGGALLEKLPKPSVTHEYCLLVSITSGGIRQSFFKRGHLVFSRLSLTAATNPAELAAVCAAEAASLHPYLLGQRLLPRDTPLPVMILAHPGQIGVFTHACKPSTDDIQIAIQDVHAAAQAIGLKTLSPDANSESLFLHLLAQKPPRMQFAPPEERRFFRLWQVRAWLVRGGAFALIAGLLFAGRAMLDVMASRAATEVLLQQAQADTQRYQAIEKTFPPLPVRAEDLRAVVARFNDLEKRSASPEPLYFAISRALETSPDIDLERIQWQLNSHPDLREIAIAHGLLPAAMMTDQRGQLDTVNAFVDALRANPGLEVTIEHMPFEIASGRPLRSINAPAQLADLKFIIRISRMR